MLYFETFVLLSYDKWVFSWTTFDIFMVVIVKIRPPSSHCISADYCSQPPLVTGASIFVEFYIDIINTNNKPAGPAPTKPLQFKRNYSTSVAQNFLGSHNIKICMPSAVSCWSKNTCFTAYGLCLHIVAHKIWLDRQMYYWYYSCQIKEVHF